MTTPRHNPQSLTRAALQASLSRRQRRAISHAAPWLCFLLVVVYGEHTDAVHREKLRAGQVWMQQLTDWMNTRTSKRFTLDDARISFRQIATANELRIPENFHPDVIDDVALPMPEVPER